MRQVEILGHADVKDAPFYLLWIRICSACCYEATSLLNRCLCSTVVPHFKFVTSEQGT